MNEIGLFKTPYNRPLKLSDPHHDFTDEILNKVINTFDEEMGWWEFSILFQVGLPAGTYQECCYFLPFAFRYIALNPDESLGCLSEIIWFISDNADNLAKDNILEQCIEAMKKCYAKWTSEFIVVHYNKKACEEKQWCLEHDDIVENSQIIIESLDDLAYYKSLETIAFDFIEEICTSTVSLKSAWYLELGSFNNRYSIIRSKKLKEMLSARNYLMECARKVKESSFIKTTTSPTYWNDLFERLNIKDTDSVFKPR